MAILAMAFVSCSVAPVSIVSEIHTVSEVSRYGSDGTLEDRRQALVVFAELAEPGDGPVQMRLAAPNGLDVWTFRAERKTIDGATYHGSASIFSDTREPLENGIWHLEVFRQDGKKAETDMTVRTRPVENRPRLVPSFDRESGILSLEGSVDPSALACSLVADDGEILFEGQMDTFPIDTKTLSDRWQEIGSVRFAFRDESSGVSLVYTFSF
jgi:hypothetical protein